VVKVLLALAMLEGLMSIIDGLTGWNLWHDTRLQHERAVATFGDPAALGTFIGMGIALALGVLVWSGPRQLRLLAIGTVAVGLPGLFFTQTRGPIVGTIIAASLILLSRTGSRLLGVCVLALMVVTISLSWSRLTSSELYHRRIAQAHTVDLRAELDRWSLKLAEERPLVGWGFGSFDRVVRTSDFSSGTLLHEEVIANTSHNTFLTILVEYGSIGLALFVVPFLVVGGRALAVARRFPDAGWLLLGCIAALVLYAFAANTLDFRFFSFVPAVPWLLLGLLRRHQSLVHEV
jgi:O-antigen ligase